MKMHRPGMGLPVLPYDLRPVSGDVLPGYFLVGLQVHLSDGFLQPEQTLFSIGLPHVLQGEHPQVWHMAVSFLHALRGTRSSGTGT
jgi:hypothetical protein